MRKKACYFFLAVFIILIFRFWFFSFDPLVGGDAGYYYSGQCKEVDGKVSGEINVIRYDHNSISVFGEIDTFTLSIEGTIDGSVIEISATSESFPGLVMQITGSKRENL